MKSFYLGAGAYTDDKQQGMNHFLPHLCWVTFSSRFDWYAHWCKTSKSPAPGGEIIDPRTEESQTKCFRQWSATSMPGLGRILMCSRKDAMTSVFHRLPSWPGLTMFACCLLGFWRKGLWSDSSGRIAMLLPVTFDLIYFLWKSFLKGCLRRNFFFGRAVPYQVRVGLFLCCGFQL